MKYIKIFIFTLFFVGAFGAHAINYGGIGIYPNKSEVDSKNSLSKAWFIYTLDPGEIKYGKVDIVNNSDESVEIEIYPVDAVTTSDGAFAPEPKDRKKIDVGSWVVLNETELFLDPREKRVVDFVMNVPENVEVGDHMGAIIAQRKKISKSSIGSGMNISTRVGARMYITIPGKMVKKLGFDDFSVETHEKERLITSVSSFSNKGNVRIRLKGKIEVVDSFGKVVNALDIPEREVFPGKSISIPVEWKPSNATGGEFTMRASVFYDSGKSLSREASFSIEAIEEKTRIFSNLSLVASVGVGAGIGVGFSFILLIIIYFVFRKKIKK